LIRRRGEFVFIGEALVGAASTIGDILESANI
jgi:hypothetical protein